MAKKLCWASVNAPEHPRVCFLVRTNDPNLLFKDVTNQVAKLVIEDLEDDSGACQLLRLDAQDNLVWKTRHPSLIETKWQVEFEYGLAEDKWNET